MPKVWPLHMRVHDMCVNTKSSTRAAVGWAVEFDGTSHFLTYRFPVGGTLMKWRHLELLRYTGRHPTLLGMGSVDEE